MRDQVRGWEQEELKKMEQERMAQSESGRKSDDVIAGHHLDHLSRGDLK
jgi:hypothetical protein